VNLLRITCARSKALPVACFHVPQEKFFTAHYAVSFPFTPAKFSADLTIAVLGRSALWSYYPDTLLLWRTKIQLKPLSERRRA
jgi:hypothetical protein